MTTAKLTEDESRAAWPVQDLEQLSTCPACGAQERQLIHSGLRDRAFKCAPGEWNTYKCGQCGAGYLDPRPNPGSIGRAYAAYFTHTGPSILNASSSWWHRFRTSQINGYLNARFGYKLAPASALAARWMMPRRREHFDHHAAFLPFPGVGARLLDVGCGNGGFLLRMRALGWDVAGVEPDPKAAAEACAAGLAVRSGLLEAAELPGDAFDAVTLHHVIEHLHDPIRTLRECYRLIKPGGLIVIVTPNFDSLGHRWFGSDWFGLEVPRHLVLFTLGSLRRALRTAGFEPEPPPGTPPSARFMFERSLQLRRGGDPIARTPPLPFQLQLKLLFLAWRADRQARVNYELSDELTILGRKLKL